MQRSRHLRDAPPSDQGIGICPTGGTPGERLTSELVGEHARLRNVVSEIEAELTALSANVGASAPIHERIAGLARQLIEPERHFAVEEAIYDALAAAGHSDLAAIAKAEHEAIEELARRLATAANRAVAEGAEALVLRLATDLVFEFRNHVFKDNNVLFPMALEVIDDETWERLERSRHG